MSLFRKHKTTQREYIDLIKGASEKWVNWLAPKNIHAGDFGTIDKITGELFVEGNIYTHEDIANIAMKFPVSDCADDDLVEIHSNEVLPLDVKTEVGIRQNGLSAEGILIESQWQFNSKRGAVLLMYKPRTTRVPDGFFAETIHIPILRNKCVVYQVWDCPGYFMYLSGKVSEKVSMSLHRKDKQASAGVDDSTSQTIRWFAKGCAGNRQHAYQPDGVYTPLYSMK